MILHTIIDQNEIFAFQGTEKHEFFKMENCIVETCISNGERRVSRLISTNPYDYLNPKFNPNTVFKI